MAVLKNFPKITEKKSVLRCHMFLEGLSLQINYIKDFTIGTSLWKNPAVSGQIVSFLLVYISYNKTDSFIKMKLRRNCATLRKTFQENSFLNCFLFFSIQTDLWMISWVVAAEIYLRKGWSVCVLKNLIDQNMFWIRIIISEFIDGKGKCKCRKNEVV